MTVKLHILLTFQDCVCVGTVSSPLSHHSCHPRPTDCSPGRWQAFDGNLSSLILCSYINVLLLSPSPPLPPPPPPSFSPPPSPLHSVTFIVVCIPSTTPIHQQRTGLMMLSSASWQPLERERRRDTLWRAPLLYCSVVGSRAPPISTPSASSKWTSYTL